MGVGIQNKTEKLFRQEEYYPEDELIPFFDTSAGRLTDFEERLILEINTPFSDDLQEQLISRIVANFEAGLNLAIAANFEAGRNLAIATPSEEESDSDNSDSFLYEDPYFRIDADVLDQAARHYYESDDE
jgi:hypothetical protein